EYQVNQLRERLAPSGKGASLFDDMTSAEARWTPASGRLQALEPIWAKSQKWYDDQMGELKTSAKAVKMASYKAGEGEARADPQDFGLPVMVDATDKGGKPLTGLDPYKKEYDDKQAAIKTAMDDLAKLIVEDKDLTEKIGGKEGLRAQL